MGGVCKAQGLIHRAIMKRDYWGFQTFMRVSYNPQSELRLGLGDYLALSGSELIVSAIVCRVLPRAFGPYRSTVAQSFLSVTTAVPIECSPKLENGNYGIGSRPLPELTGRFIVRADDDHTTPLSASGKPFRLSIILLSALVRLSGVLSN